MLCPKAEALFEFALRQVALDLNKGIRPWRLQIRPYPETRWDLGLWSTQVPPPPPAWCGNPPFANMEHNCERSCPQAKAQKRAAKHIQPIKRTTAGQAFLNCRCSLLLESIDSGYVHGLGPVTLSLPVVCVCQHI